MQRVLLIILLSFIPPLTYAKICGSVDIRSEMVEFEKLRGCSLIMGNLFIVLLENVTAEEFNSYTFPELKEITGYLLVYSVVGLKTLGGLFPNLSVIRGNNLFENYALILYGLNDLEQVRKNAFYGLFLSNS